MGFLSKVTKSLGGAVGSIGGALIGGPTGASIGGALGNSLFGSTGPDSADMFGRSQDVQERWMQNQMQWRVQDAKKAGIHPVAAIGSNLSPPSSPGYSVGDVGGGIGGTLSDMGQDLGRAIGASMSGETKYRTSLQALQIERGELENSILREQLKRLQPAGTPSFPVTLEPSEWYGIGERLRPGFQAERSGAITTAPLPGQANVVPGIKHEPSEQFSGSGGMQPSVNPQSRWVENPLGGIDRLPGEAWNMDDTTSPGAILWRAQNSLLPGLPFGQRFLSSPPKRLEKPGQTGWTYKVGIGYLPDFRPLTGWEKYDQQWTPLAPR